MGINARRAGDARVPCIVAFSNTLTAKAIRTASFPQRLSMDERYENDDRDYLESSLPCSRNPWKPCQTGDERSQKLTALQPCGCLFLFFFRAETSDRSIEFSTPLTRTPLTLTFTGDQEIYFSNAELANCLYLYVSTTDLKTICIYIVNMWI